MIVKDVVILKEVANDLNGGKAFYDQREAGVGDYFWDSLLADIESLLIYAGIHSREHGLYRMLAKRFPYAVYYEIADEIAYVVAVLPMRRNPSWIKRKMKNRAEG
ncbi:MAG: type II toxin-antitoxin system RelE/ParE family toxin [Syntrophobacteraceae bacterium]